MAHPHYTAWIVIAAGASLALCVCSGVPSGLSEGPTLLFTPNAPEPMPHMARVPTQPEPLRVEGMTRVRITPDKVQVDGSFVRRVLARLDRERSEALPAKPVHVSLENGLVPGSALRGDYFVEPLYDILVEHHTHMREAAELIERHTVEPVSGVWSPRPDELPELPVGDVLIEVDERISYKTLTQILYTAGQAEFGDYYFAVLGREGRVGVLRFEAPKYRVGMMGLDDGGAPCVQPSVHLREGGALLRAHPAVVGGYYLAMGDDLADSELGEGLAEALGLDGSAGLDEPALGLDDLEPSAPVEPSPAPEPKKEIGDACAWLPNAGGEFPHNAYRERLERLKRLGDLCSTQMVHAADEIRWGQVALAVAIGEDMEVEPMFTVGGAEGSCDGEGWWPGEPLE